MPHWGDIVWTESCVARKTYEKKKMHQAKAGTNCICLSNRKRGRGGRLLSLYQSKTRREARNKVRMTGRIPITRGLICVTLWCTVQIKDIFKNCKRCSYTRTIGIHPEFLRYTKIYSYPTNMQEFEFYSCIIMSPYMGLSRRVK